MFLLQRIRLEHVPRSKDFPGEKSLLQKTQPPFKCFPLKTVVSAGPFSACFLLRIGRYLSFFTQTGYLPIYICLSSCSTPRLHSTPHSTPTPTSAPSPNPSPPTHTPNPCRPRPRPRPRPPLHRLPSTLLCAWSLPSRWEARSKLLCVISVFHPACHSRVQEMVAGAGSRRPLSA